MKTAVITGAGSGIGAATAALFSAHGYATILIGRNRANLETTIGLLKGSSSNRIEICDLQNTRAVEDLGKKLIQNHDIDVLVNNAGIIERLAATDVTEKSIREQFDANLIGPMLLTKHLLPVFYRKSSGAIVNVASSLGIRPMANTGVYSASKAAMINWTQSLALEAAPHHVRVNAVAPGIVETPILTNHKRELTDDERKSLGELHPLGRLGQPDDIAQAIWYLATAPWTTGAILTVDGGISLTQN